MVDIHSEDSTKNNGHKRDSTEHGGQNSPSGKRNKRDWLAFSGVKHTRVGDAFQVTALPTPKPNDFEKKDSIEPKVEEKTETSQQKATETTETEKDETTTN